MRKIIALIAALVAAVTLTAPAQAMQSADDVSDALFIAKAAWLDMDYSSQDTLCEGWYTMPYYMRNTLAKSIRSTYNDDLGYISVYQSRRIASRLLNWAC